MSRVHRMLDRMARAEARVRDATFLSPCVAGGRVRVLIEGIPRDYRPTPRSFEGWGIFAPVDEVNARLVEVADARESDRYMRAFPVVRLHLVCKLRRLTWLAFPANAASLAARFELKAPVAVYLVRGGAPFDAVLTRCDGKNFWFEGADRRADPRTADELRRSARHQIGLPDLRQPGLTPELRDAYAFSLARKKVLEERARARLALTVEQRLTKALEVGGGKLGAFRERDGYYVVEWTDRLGRRHSSSIATDGFDVQSAGAICLQGRDRDFDLTSLVGVVTDAPAGVFF